jgi:hypothetical protein
MHDANLYSTAVSRTDRQSNVLSPTNQALIDSNDTNANRLSIDSNLLSNASQRDIFRSNNPAVYLSTNTVSSISTANDPISRASGRQAAIRRRRWKKERRGWKQFTDSPIHQFTNSPFHISRYRPIHEFTDSSPDNINNKTD